MNCNFSHNVWLLCVPSLESLHYNGSLAITGAIRGPSKEKLYQELGLESHQCNASLVITGAKRGTSLEKLHQ